MAVAIALATVLGFVKIKLPYLVYGGSVSLKALPIFVVAFRHGGKLGIMSGILYGVVDFMIEPYIVHPIQFLLDYPVAFGGLGVAGVVCAIPNDSLEVPPVWSLARIRMGILLGTSLRFVSHFTSGIVFWGQYAPEGQPVWLYSLVYNGSYIGMEAIVYMFLIPLVARLITLKAR